MIYTGIMCLLIGTCLGYVYGLADARQTSDVLDCIEDEYCPGMDEEFEADGGWEYIQPKPTSSVQI